MDRLPSITFQEQGTYIPISTSPKPNNVVALLCPCLWLRLRYRVMNLLIGLLLLVLVLAVVIWILTRLPIPEPWKSVLIGVFVLIAILVAAGHFGYLPGR